MKRFLCALLIAVMALMVSGCTNSQGKTFSEYIAEIAESEPFDVIYSGTQGQILRHKDSGVFYFANRTEGGVTVMLNPDGTPYTGELEGDE